MQMGRDIRTYVIEPMVTPVPATAPVEAQAAEPAEPAPVPS